MQNRRWGNLQDSGAVFKRIWALRLPQLRDNASLLAPEIFTQGRDVSARLGLTPRRHSSGDKTRMDSTAKIGERILRRPSTGALGA